MDEQNIKAIHELNKKLEDFQPAIPQELVQYYLRSVGFKSDDPKTLTLVALATQKFLSEVVSDTMAQCKNRQENTLLKDKSTGGQKEQKKYTLSIEDLQEALKDYDIKIKKPEYYSDQYTSSKNPLE
jgi:transcription initiation factor TFIID subunit 10